MPRKQKKNAEEKGKRIRQFWFHFFCFVYTISNMKICISGSFSNQINWELAEVSQGIEQRVIPNQSA